MEQLEYLPRRKREILSMTSGDAVSTSVKKLDQIERVEFLTHETALQIIDKTGPPHNPAGRDPCPEYMTAISLIFGALTADHCEDTIAAAAPKPFRGS